MFNNIELRFKLHIKLRFKLNSFTLFSYLSTTSSLDVCIFHLLHFRGFEVKKNLNTPRSLLQVGYIQLIFFSEFLNRTLNRKYITVHISRQCDRRTVRMGLALQHFSAEFDCKDIQSCLDHLILFITLLRKEQWFELHKS